MNTENINMIDRSPEYLNITSDIQNLFAFFNEEMS